MSKFVIKKTSAGQFRFNLHAGNGEIILTSESYVKKASALNGIESVKKNSLADGRYDKLTNKGGKPYFNLKATNGQIIGTSEAYSSESARDHGIESVKANAAKAETDDQNK
jgi:uncharacterized protein YegP (UPF0339 family)